MADNQTMEKRIAGEEAAGYVENGMVVGLGTGSTVRYTIEKVAERIKTEGLHIQGVPTSERTRQLAEELGIPLVSLEEVEALDVTIDGADEVDSHLNGIKGGGGALLFEKIVASASKQNIWVLDSQKKVDVLGQFPLPVEVVPFASPTVFRALTKEKLCPVIRKDRSDHVVTDSGNWIIDLHLERIDDPNRLETWLNMLPGVVENGLFLNRADLALVAYGETVHKYERLT